MQISSFEILAIVRELQDLLGAYIDKVYQIGKNEILLRLRKRGAGKVHLLIKAGKLLFKTKKTFETPEKPSMFAMILRKYLKDGRVSRIYQHDFDRIVVLEAERSGELYRVVSEFIPNGNIILVNKEWKILMPLKEQTWSHRIIKPKEFYIFPPSKGNLIDMSIERFSDIIKKSDKDLVRTLAIDLGLGGLYAEEICYLSNINKSKSTKELTDKEIYDLFSSMRTLIDVIGRGELSPEIVKEDSKIIAVTPIHLRKFDSYEIVRKTSINETLEEIIDKIEETEDKDENKGKIERQMEQQREAIEDLMRQSEEKKREGDLLYIHIKEIDEILEKLRKISKEKEKEESIMEVESLDMVEDVDLHDGVVRLKIEDKILEVNFRKSAAENANHAYKLSKKFKEKAEGAKEALRSNEKKLKERKSKKNKKEEKKFWFEKYRWCISSDGNLIVGGKDAKTNEKIVKKHMEDKDIYVHADIHGAPSCILKCRDIHGKEKEITEKSIEEACQFAGIYSKAWKQFGEVTVYWVYPDQVSKTPESGEYLPRGAFVIRGKRNYVRCKMEMAIGEIYIGDIKKIMGGPVNAVKSRSERFVVIQPGYIEREKFAKTLAEKLNVTPDDVLRVLPSGNIQIMETKGVIIEELR